MSEFKGTKGKWYNKVTRSSNINGNEAIVVFSEYNNPSIDKGVCRLSILNSENKVVQSISEMKANALLISKAPEMLEMLEEFIYSCCGEQECEEELIKGLGITLYNSVLKAKSLIKKATEL